MKLTQHFSDFSKSDRSTLKAKSQLGPNPVSVDWDVNYDKIGRYVLVRYKISVTEADTYLLQIWAQDEAPGIWPPEERPWAAAVIEFSADEHVTKCKGGLIDRKWAKADWDKKFIASVSGHIVQNGSISAFGPFTKEFVFPNPHQLIKD